MGPLDGRAAASVVVLCGGEPPCARARELVDADAVVLAADSGLHHAAALGLDAERVIGDFDSASPVTIARAEARGAVLERHPAAKDATDLELALDRAVHLGATDILVLGGGGGRLDHLIANVALLAAPALRDRRVRAVFGPALLQILHGPATLTVAGPPGSFLSLVPVHGAASRITTEGLRFPLVDEDLPFATSRGVSNELLAPVAGVHLGAGMLAVVQPFWGDPAAEAVDRTGGLPDGLTAGPSDGPTGAEPPR